MAGTVVLDEHRRQPDLPASSCAVAEPTRDLLTPSAAVGHCRSVGGLAESHLRSTSASPGARKATGFHWVRLNGSVRPPPHQSPEYGNYLLRELLFGNIFLNLSLLQYVVGVLQEDQGIYQSKVRELISDNQYRLIVNVNDLRRKNEKRANRLLSNAFEELVAFQRALKDFVASIDATYAKQYEEFYIGLEGSFGSKHVSPRTLTSCFLSCVVCVEGIVTKCSLVRPKVVRSVHYCPATKKTIERRYSDLTTLMAFPSSSVYPTKDEENNPLETEYGLSVYKDHQIITIQEMPEKAPAGQLPRSVDVILDDDLVDKVKPGDRVQVVGTYRCLPGKKGGYTSGNFRTVLIACNVKQMSKDVQPSFSAEDIAKIKKFSKTRSKVWASFNRFEGGNGFVKVVFAYSGCLCHWV
ncbi:DNA replication licensing factor MCM3-like [Tupaia chinensis]|uniref:DNA replication licensing factor MCM3-like n=1 Tax=Tupaia chinensis TaxID=246437 RepID=UPI000FFBAB66|nr:DNA replication licensing factor MCM3-like [Tupaia chinensis]